MKTFSKIVKIAKTRHRHRTGENKSVFMRLEVERLLGQVLED